MSFIFRKIKMNKVRLTFIFQLKKGFAHQTLIPVITRNAGSSSYVNPKKLQAQIDKFLVRKRKLRNKFYDASDTYYGDHSKQLTPHPKTRTKQLRQSVIMREKNVSGLVKMHVQDLIDSGELGEDVQSLKLTFTKAVMSSPNHCRIFWDPALSSKDLEISEALNRLSGQIRHILISSNVMNNAPEIHFYMDPDAKRLAEVDKLFKEHGFSEVTVTDDKPEAEVSENCEKSNKTSAFGLDYDSMYSKLTFLKKTDGIDKS